MLPQWHVLFRFLYWRTLAHRKVCRWWLSWVFSWIRNVFLWCFQRLTFSQSCAHLCRRHAALTQAHRAAASHASVATPLATPWSLAKGTHEDVVGWHSTSLTNCLSWSEWSAEIALTVKGKQGEDDRILKKKSDEHDKNRCPIRVSHEFYINSAKRMMI